VRWTAHNIIGPLVVAAFVLMALFVVTHPTPPGGGYRSDPCRERAIILHRDHPEHSEQAYFDDCAALRTATSGR
jgi:hypothetical protein